MIDDSLFTYKAIVLKVVDGDTIDLELDLGFGSYRRDRFRLNRINAYETSLRDGTTAEEKQLGIDGANFLKSLIESKQIIVKTHKNSTDKYGRYLADIFFNNENINDLMVIKKYAIYKTY